MRTAIYITTTVSPNGTIEIISPQLRPGMTADIIITIQEDQMTKRSALDNLAEMPGHRLFQTADEVDAYIQEERGAWEQ